MILVDLVPKFQWFVYYSITMYVWWRY